MKTVFFVRHAESEANAAGLMAGMLDTPLSSKGKQQAKQAGKDLSNKSIELVVCSPLTRTRQTAEIIAKEIGYDPTKILANKAFIERSFGPYEGRTFKEYLAHNEANTLLDGMETTEEIYQRVKVGFDWLSKQKANTILLVSHGATGRMVKVVAQKKEHSHFHSIERLGNTEIFEFSLD